MNKKDDRIEFNLIQETITWTSMSARLQEPCSLTETFPILET